MKTIVSVVLLLLCISTQGKSQTDDNGAPYFPLRVGNAFYYRCYDHDPGGTDSSFVVSRITGTKTFKGKRYYYCTNFLGTPNSYYLRYNASSGNLVRYDSTASGCTYELALFRLSAVLGDSCGTTCIGISNTKCIRIYDTTVFGVSARTKIFEYSHSTVNGYYSKLETYFSRNIGGLSYYNASSSPHESFWSKDYLQGCKINGIVRGDTIDHITPNYADSGRYFPLQVGNSFYYKYSRYGMGLPFHIDSGIYVTRITDTSRINGKLYYKLNTFLTNDSVNYFRYDLDSGMLVAYYPYAGCNYEEYFYKLISIPFDSIKTSCLYNNPQRCEVLKDTTIFNLQKKLKTFIYHIESQYAGNYIESFFVKDFGLVHYKNLSVEYHWGHSALAKYELVGAKINGVVFGDTTSVIPPSYADSSRYYPLKIGNKFYYKRNYTYHTYSPDTTIYDSSYYIIKITDTTRLHGKLYYKMNSFISGTKNYFRHDLDSGFLFSYDSLSWCTNYPYEFKCFMLSSNANQDGSGTCWLNNFYSRCFQIHDTSAFGSTRKVKGYMTSWGGTTGGHYYTWLLKDIGVCQYEGYSYSYSFGYAATTKYRLIGAFVDGVKYGDTNTTGIKQIGTSVPDKFGLFQNYPNPFNPTTNIKYQIINSKLVTLKIYDILGKEVSTLVNEKQLPGVYEVSWDASQFPSGVYFYKLTAGDFSEVKRMLMIK